MMNIRHVQQRLSQSYIYRIVRWVVKLVVGILLFVTKVIFFTWIREKPHDGYRSFSEQKDKNTDDIWGESAESYYSKDAPEPFENSH